MIRYTILPGLQRNGAKASEAVIQARTEHPPENSKLPPKKYLPQVDPSGAVSLERGGNISSLALMGVVSLELIFGQRSIPKNKEARQLRKGASETKALSGFLQVTGAASDKTGITRCGLKGGASSDRQHTQSGLYI